MRHITYADSFGDMRIGFDVFGALVGIYEKEQTRTKLYGDQDERSTLYLSDYEIEQRDRKRVR